MRLSVALATMIFMLGGCAPPNSESQTSTTGTLSFPGSMSYVPNPAVVGVTETVTFTVMNNSAVSTATNIPYIVNRDGVQVFSGTLASIAPLGTTTGTFTTNDADSNGHVYEVVLDQNNTTGFIDYSTNTSSITIVAQPVGTT
jgi:hypothetical protein